MHELPRDECLGGQHYDVHKLVSEIPQVTLKFERHQLVQLLAAKGTQLLLERGGVLVAVALDPLDADEQASHEGVAVLLDQARRVRVSELESGRVQLVQVDHGAAVALLEHAQDSQRRRRRPTRVRPIGFQPLHASAGGGMWMLGRSTSVGSGSRPWRTITHSFPAP